MLSDLPSVDSKNDLLSQVNAIAEHISTDTQSQRIKPILSAKLAQQMLAWFIFQIRGEVEERRCCTKFASCQQRILRNCICRRTTKHSASVQAFCISPFSVRGRLCSDSIVVSSATNDKQTSECFCIIICRRHLCHMVDMIQIINIYMESFHKLTQSTHAQSRFFLTSPPSWLTLDCPLEWYPCESLWLSHKQV